MAQIVKKYFDSVVVTLLPKKILHPEFGTTYFRRRLHINTEDSSRPESATLGNRSIQEQECNRLKMSAWQIHDYGEIQELQYSNNVKMPQIHQANECLIKVLATSVNPIDVLMLSK